MTAFFLFLFSFFFVEYVKNCYVGRHSDIYKSVWFKVVMVIDTIVLYIFYTNLIDVDLDLGSQECEKARTFGLKISQGFQSIWMGFYILLRLYGLMNVIFLFRPFNFEGR